MKILRVKPDSKYENLTSIVKELDYIGFVLFWLLFAEIINIVHHW